MDVGFVKTPVALELGWVTVCESWVLDPWQDGNAKIVAVNQIVFKPVQAFDKAWKNVSNDKQINKKILTVVSV